MKRNVLYLIIAAIAGACLTLFGVVAYNNWQHQQAEKKAKIEEKRISKLNSTFDESYSEFVFSSEILAKSGQSIANQYIKVLPEPVFDDDETLDIVSKKYTELKNAGTLDKFAKKKDQMEKHYEKLKSLSTKDIKHGKEKFKKADNLYKTDNDLADIVNDPGSSILTFKDDFNSEYKLTWTKMDSAMALLKK